jgi:hypothetical protein
MWNDRAVRRTLTRFASAVLLVLAATTSPALADPDPEVEAPTRNDPKDFVHHGFYFRAAVGPAGLRLSGDGPAGDASFAGFGPALTLAFGGSIEDGLVVAGLWHLTLGESPPGSDAFAGQGDLFIFAEQLGLLIDWYPDPRRGWHAGGAIGVGFLGASPVSGSGAGISGYDATASLQGGYDWWISRKWTLGVLVVGTAGTRSSMDGPVGQSGQSAWSYRLGPGSIALEFTVGCN